MKKKLATCFCLLLCMAMNIFSFSQDHELRLGHLELKTIATTSSLAQKAAVGKLSFHRRIGGISFEQVGAPDFNIEGEVIKLNYIGNRPDGSRLKITIGAQLPSVYFDSIPDWQLVPIAKFANSANNTVFTLIADNDYNNEGEPILYHPAFKNNLLGLRMFQADLLFSRSGDGYLADLPRKNDTLLLADSEAGLGSFGKDSAGYDHLTRKLELLCPEYSSYVLTDWGEEVNFGVSGGRFYISGEPYYLFTSWALDKVRGLYAVSNSRNILSYDTLGNIPLLRDPDFIFIKTLKYRQVYSWTAKQAELCFERLASRYPEPFKTDFLRYKNYIAELSLPPSRPDFADKVNLLVDQSYKMRELNQQIFEFNPAVFNSCIITMRYAAFFRYVKEKYPVEWARFMVDINNVRPRPSRNPGNIVNKGIQTPNKITRR